MESLTKVECKKLGIGDKFFVKGRNYKTPYIVVKQDNDSTVCKHKSHPGGTVRINNRQVLAITTFFSDVVRWG